MLFYGKKMKKNFMCGYSAYIFNLFTEKIPYIGNERSL